MYLKSGIRISLLLEMQHKKKEKKKVKKEWHYFGNLQNFLNYLKI